MESLHECESNKRDTIIDVILWCCERSSRRLFLLANFVSHINYFQTTRVYSLELYFLNSQLTPVVLITVLPLNVSENRNCNFAEPLVLTYKTPGE